MTTPRKHKIAGFGYPRSGTLYFAEVLRAMGLAIGHETYNEHGAVGYNIMGARPWWFDIVCYFTRDPRYALASCAANGFPKYASQDRWVKYNTDAEAYLAKCRSEGCSTFTFKIEECDGALPYIAKALKMNGIDWDAIDDVSRTTNHRKAYEPYKWNDMSRELRALARKRGYENANAQLS